MSNHGGQRKGHDGGLAYDTPIADPPEKALCIVVIPNTDYNRLMRQPTNRIQPDMRRWRAGWQGWRGLWAVVVILPILAGCATRDLTPPALPTQTDIESLGTALALTAIAPPAGYERVRFANIDANLEALSGWRYTALVQFDGVFARTTRPARARTFAEVEFNQVASARRVVAEIENDLQQDSERITYEAVQLGEDAFLVRDGACLADVPDDARIAASLGAGSLIGGVADAPFAGQKAVINGVDVWAYTPTLAQINLPSIGLENATVLAFTGELWVAPQYDAIVRYYLTLEVENATVFGATLPVTGTLLIRYDVTDIGIAPNIGSVPFGC